MAKLARPQAKSPNIAATKTATEKAYALYGYLIAVFATRSPLACLQVLRLTDAADLHRHYWHYHYWQYQPSSFWLLGRTFGVYDFGLVS